MSAPDERTGQLRQDASEEQQSHATTKLKLSAELAANGALKAQLEQLTEEVSKHEADAMSREDLIVSLKEEVAEFRQSL